MASIVPFMKEFDFTNDQHFAIWLTQNECDFSKTIESETEDLFFDYYGEFLAKRVKSPDSVQIFIKECMTWT